MFLLIFATFYALLLAYFNFFTSLQQTDKKSEYLMVARQPKCLNRLFSSVIWKVDMRTLNVCP